MGPYVPPDPSKLLEDRKLARLGQRADNEDEFLKKFWRWGH